MTKVPVCVDPVVSQINIDESIYYMEDVRADYINQVKPFQIDFELLSRCAGACAWCYASSDTYTDYIIPREKVFALIDEAADLEIKHITWVGGDPLLHPNWFEIMTYAGDRGIRNKVAISGMLSKRDAKRLCQLQSNMQRVGIHISTINPEAYSQIHTNPKTLEKKIEGYRNLLEAGYPADQVYGIITLTKPAMDTLEETFDWFIDQMGVELVCLVQFKAEGFGAAHRDWEISLSDVRKVLEYRAKKLTKDWLRVGTMDGGIFYCRTMICIQYDGAVTPCAVMRGDCAVGNIYQESLKDIFEKNRDYLLFNFRVKGYCGEGCENRDVCFGCRANAHLYVGDVEASDPKCPFNPDAQEFVYGGRGRCTPQNPWKA